MFISWRRRSSRHRQRGIGGAAALIGALGININLRRRPRSGISSLMAAASQLVGWRPHLGVGAQG